MSTLDILAKAACDVEQPQIMPKPRFDNLVKARAKMAEIRAQRKAGIIVSKPKPKKNINPNWRSENIKKAHAALMKKRLYKKLMAQDTEPEEDPKEDPKEDFEGEDEEVD